MVFLFIVLIYMLISQGNAIPKPLNEVDWKIWNWFCVSTCKIWWNFTGVQSAAVNVICELARKNPQNYLSLAPLFFKLMTSSSNNWVLIKIIKLVSIISTCRQPSLLMQRNVEASRDWITMLPVSNLWKLWKRWNLFEHLWIGILKTQYVFFFYFSLVH